MLLTILPFNFPWKRPGVELYAVSHFDIGVEKELSLTCRVYLLLSYITAC
jgi:hypothetical protein